MNNVFVGNALIVNSATYYEPQYKRDGNGNFLLGKDNKKVVESYKTKTLSGNYIVEDQKDGTSIATKFNVYKDTYLIDSNSLSITKVTKI